MARVLIVGCGCRGRELAAALAREGHAVRGTTRRETNLEAVQGAGAEAALADPDRLSTLFPCIEGVAVVCWLMGTAAGDAGGVAALHGARLETLLHKLVDTPVRGVVYEGAGTVPGRLLQQGAGIARRAGETYRLPVEVVERDPSDRGPWLAAMTAAVKGVLSSR